MLVVLYNVEKKPLYVDAWIYCWTRILPMQTTFFEAFQDDLSDIQLHLLLDLAHHV